MAYDSTDIHSLGDLEAIRSRPGMYIGDTSNPQQLFIEALDNALDEVQSGYSDRAVVRIDTSKNLYSVRDYGRGIPIGKSSFKDLLGEEHEIETIQLVYTKNHSGGKFGGSAYKKSRGLHGIGLKTINALSTHALARTYRKGKSVELIMSRGDVLDLNYLKVDELDGTYVEFAPDPEVFETDIIPISVIIELAGVSKAFGSDVEVYVDDELQELPYNNLFDLLPKNDNENEFFTASFHVESESTESIDVALKYTSDTNTMYRGYTNTIYNSSGGSHIRFFESCYKEAWKKYLTKEFKLEDTLIGMRALVGVFISNESMAFAGQTKERLTTRVNYFDQFRSKLVKEIRKFFDKNEGIRKGLIRRFVEYRSNLDKMRASRELEDMIYVNNDTTVTGGRVRRKSVVDKLRECSSKSRENTRLIISEGDSAGGALLQARDVRYDAILPIRGKILNVSNVSPVRAMKNAEVRSIVNASGTGLGDECDVNRSRYDKYFIGCDADADGYNIAALLISIFVNLLPDIVRHGMLYVIVPPLYSWNDKGVKRYTNNLSDIKDKSSMTRFKGLGEMDPEDLKATCLDEENQVLVQVQYPDDLVSFNQAMTSSKMRYDMLCDMGLIVHERIKK